MKRFLILLLTLSLIPLAGCAGEINTATKETVPPSLSETESATEESKTTKEDSRVFPEDPSKDGVLNVFFVSNSTCYYFTDELYGLLSSAGYEKVNLVLAYYSGCSIQTHYEWYRINKKGYQLRVYNEKGLKTTANQSLMDAMRLYNWDFISFDNNARSFASGDTQTAIDVAEPYFGLLFQALKEKFPKANFAWHQVWANEIGYDGAFQMTSKDQRNKVYQAKKGVMEQMMKTYGIGGVPTGDAWEKVRDLPLFTQPLSAFSGVDHFTLCSRIASNKFKDDFSHDGDIGGGQYLNACVWFEILTGKSCVENPFRPKYSFGGKDVSLSEEKISVLKNAAHEAVAEFKAKA